MRRLYCWLAFISCFSCLLLGSLNRASGQSPEARVKAALDDAQAWLGQNENAPTWRKFLKSEELAAQVQKGRAADRTLIRQIHQLYSGTTPGLDKSHFVAVRQALEAWLQDLSQLRLEELPQAARDAQKNFVPIRAEDVQAARSELVAGMTRLQSFLAGGCPQNAENWRQFLRWNELEAQLKSESAPDWNALEAIAERYYVNQSGLEVSHFLALREALNRYADALAFAATPDAKQSFEKNLAELAQHLESYAKKANTDDAIAIGKKLGWLEKYGQAKELVATVRQHFWCPNLYVQLSEQMLKTAIETDVEEKVPVNEVILGTTMVGEAEMKGRVSLDLVPCETHAAFDIMLAGTTLSTNVGYNGPVTIYSDGVTTVDGRKRVLVDAMGISSRPARAVCQTVSTINDIAANSNLVRNIAWKKARKAQPQAEQLASEVAARKVEAKMNEEATELLDRGSYMFAEKFRNPLVRRGGFPKTMKINTSEDTLYITGMQTGADQLAAPNAPPQLTGKHDLAVRFHESLVANMSQAFWGGVTLTDERLQEIIENLTGDVPEELAIGQDDDPWSITFAKERPIEARFEEQGFTVWIRGTRFTRGDQEVKRSLVISAKYKMEKGAYGIKMNRDGEVAVEFAKSSGTQSVQQVTMRTFMKKKFEKLFKPEIVSDGLALPGNFQGGGKFRLQQMQCAEGWLALGWQQPARTERTASRKKTPIVMD